VPSNGRSPSVLGAKVYARMFNDVLQRQKTPLDGVVTLLDSTPRIVARTRNQDKYVGQPPTRDFVEQAAQAAEGSWRSVLLEGTPAYSAWSRSQVTGLTIGIGLPAAPVDEPLWRSFLALVTAGTAVCGIGLVLALEEASGERLADQRIFLRQRGRPIFSARTDAEGVLRTPGLERGVYEVSCPGISTSFRLDLR